MTILSSFVQRASLFITLFLVITATAAAQTQTVRGRVTDSRTGEPLTGATIILRKGDRSLTTSAGLDGSFLFRSVPEAKYELTVQFVGYHSPAPQQVDVRKGELVTIPVLSLAANEVVLSGVEVRAARGRENDEFARKSERVADNVINIVSARAIEISPDITVGNVLQRVSGVSVERTSTGDGQYAIIRGMDKRYNYTSVNGIIVPSPDDKYRSIPLDMFQADMIERLELTKAMTPGMEADAIGGAMNLVMKNAPNHFTLSANMATGASQLFFDRSFSGFSHSGVQFQAPWEKYGASYVAKPSDFNVNELKFHKPTPANFVGGLSIGDRLFHKKLGYMVAASYSRQYRGSNTLFYQANPQPLPDPAPNTPTFLYIRNRQYSDLQSRLGLHTSIDYAFNNNHKINFYGLFLQLDDNEHRYEEVTNLTGTGETDHNDRVIFTRKNLYNATLSGSDLLLKNLQADWALSYALARSISPDWIDFSVFKAAGDSTYYLSQIAHHWEHTREDSKSGYLNFTYTPRSGMEFKAGGMYRAKNRDNLYTQYVLQPDANPDGSRKAYTTAGQASYHFLVPDNARADTTEGLTYSGTESVTAAYLQGKITIKDKLQILAGVRAELTHQYYYSLVSSAIPGKTATYDYQDILPSVHLKYGLTDRQNLRLSYFSSISRPSLYDLEPGQSGSSDEYIEQGNYNLKHSQAANLDLRYENFLTATDNIMAGVFYKRITNPIERAFVEVAAGTYNYEPSNPQGSATNYGFELVFSKFIRNWGIGGNYSYTHSSITTNKRIYGRDSNGSLTNTLGYETRPLQGQSAHIANFSLMYRDAKSGLDAQLSWVYTGKRIAVVSPYLGLDYWQLPSSQFDFSAEKRFRRHFTVFVKATNLLNDKLTQVVLHANAFKGLPGQNMADKITARQEIFKGTYLAGIRYKL